jgi:hypothetical protein
MCAGEVQKTFHSCHLRLQKVYQKLISQTQSARDLPPEIFGAALQATVLGFSDPMHRIEDTSVQPTKPTPEKWLSPSSPRTPRSTTSSRCAYSFRRRLHRRLRETHAASHRSAIRRARAHALLPARAPQNPRAELSGHAGKHTRCRVMRRARAAPQHAPRRHTRWSPPPLRLHFAFCFFPC